MNLVVFSWNFPPLNNAEAFCTARFVSALAQDGHNVHVVTMSHPCQMSDEDVRFFVDSRIKTTRVPLTYPPRRNLKQCLHYMTEEWGSADFGCAIHTLRAVLKATEAPVLISRANPSSSHIVAWHCRQYATMWLAHFSDPFPWFTGDSLRGRIKHCAGVHWGKRILRDATAMSLTCSAAERFFAETYGSLYRNSRHLILTHIGEPRYSANCSCEKTWSVPCVLHAGELHTGRGGREILTVIRALNAGGLPCCFKQIGKIGKELESFFRDARDAELVSEPSPGYATAMAGIADACFIADLDVGIGYSPFLPSKFVYQIFTDTPLVLYTFPNSCMDSYARNYPEAGLFPAYIGDMNSLKTAVATAIQANRGEIKRDKIRMCFTRQKVAADFRQGMRLHA